MRVLVCGGRDLEDGKPLWAFLDALDPKPTHIIQGGARGADMAARLWASSREIPCTTYPARWKVHGKAAGPIRNQQMIDEERIDLVVVERGGGGTKDMRDRAERAGLRVVEVHP